MGLCFGYGTPTDRIDLLCQHRVDRDVPIEDVAGVTLTAEDLDEIEAAADTLEVHGSRYSESSQRLIDE